MDPQEISKQLRLIADRIDASKQPSRELVASSLRKLVANLQTAGIPGYEDVEGLEAIIKKLSDAIEKKSAGGVEAVVDDALTALQAVKNKKRQKQQKEQLDPRAQHKQLPLKKTGSRMAGEPEGVTLSFQEAKDMVKFISYANATFPKEIANGMNKSIVDRVTFMVGRVLGVIDPSGNGV